jgi:hypothetical protein
MISPAGIRAAVTASTLLLAGLGLAFLIAPAETTAALLPGAAAPILAQLLGAALLGFASMNWIARGSALGGIYGRAVVAANQAHFVIGALVLVRRAFDGGSPATAFWLLAAVYGLGALFFSYLAFFATGLPATEGSGAPGGRA